MQRDHGRIRIFSAAFSWFRGQVDTFSIAEVWEL
jgi:hypothetical protein